MVRAGDGRGGAIVPLSVYDLLTGPIYITLAFFYRNTLDGEALRASLAHTLRRFPIVSGRMKRGGRGGLDVVCNDRGVLFVEAASRMLLPDYGPDRTAKADIGQFYSNVNPLWVIDRDTPLLTVKLTQLAGGGSALGVCFNHCLGDATATLMFLESWSREHRGLPYPEPSHDRARVDAFGHCEGRASPAENRHFEAVRVRDKLGFYARVAVESLRLVSEVVRFSADEVRRIKDAAIATAPKGRWISTNDALTAHLWKLFGELRARPSTCPESLLLIASVRQSMGAALPPCYFGNATSHTSPTLTAGALRLSPLGEVAAVIRAAHEELSAERLGDDIAFLRGQRDAGRSGSVMPLSILGVFDQTITLNNWTNVPVYSVDFGGGTPSWHDLPVVQLPWSTMILATPEGDGGRDVHVSLPRDRRAELLRPEWQSRLHRYSPSKND
jgi:shikimate O-hydroxycinnamoyltransferase